MTTTAQHTPTPWVCVCGAIETAQGVPIAHMDREPGNGTLPVERDENARFIVRAVNAHDALVAALEEIANLPGGEPVATVHVMRRLARAALRQAKEPSHAHDRA